MSLSDLTSSPAVRLAIEEYDSIGQKSFLAKYKFGRALRYFLEVDGKQYDSKAIAGAAYGYQYPDRGALASAEFSGGEPVRAKLEELGYAVIVLPSSSTADRRPGN